MSTIGYIIFSLIILQYIYALFALIQLAYLKFSIKKYIFFNLIIILVFFIGSTIFLIMFNKNIKESKKEFLYIKKEEISDMDKNDKDFLNKNI